jgi:hypothetical protein
VITLSAKRKISLLILILTGSSTCAFAQEVTLRNKRAGEAKHELRQDNLLEPPLLARARALAASTAVEAFKWEDRQAAVRVISQASDLLWDSDPDRSRMWLKRAWELADDLVAEDADDTSSRYRTDSAQSKARTIILAVAQRRDPQLFDSFLEQLANEKEKIGSESRRGIFEDRNARSEQLLNLALAIVKSDPTAAANLAERSLNDGVSFQLQRVLFLLRQSDEVAANRVFDAALNRLAKAFSHPSEGQIIASYLFAPGYIVGVSSDNAISLAIDTQLPASYKTPAEADPARARRFLAIIQQNMLMMPSPSSTANPSLRAQEFIALRNSLIDGFKRYAPELLIPIEQRLSQLIPDLAPARTNNRLPEGIRDNLLSGNLAGADEKRLNKLYVEGLEAAADKEIDPIARKLAYVQAALATAADDLELGRKIAAKIQEKELREQVLSFLVYRTALTTLEKGQLDTAINLAAETKPMQRALVLVTAAQRLLAARYKKNEGHTVNYRIRALELLSDTERILKLDNNSIDELHIRLGFIAAVAPLDSIRAFNSFNDVVTAINKTNSFDPTDTNAPRIANLGSFSSQSLLPRIRSGYGLRDALVPLVRADFEGAVYAASRLSAPAVRGTCMMEIAQIYLERADGESKVTIHTETNNPSLMLKNISVNSSPPHH